MREINTKRSGTNCLTGKSVVVVVVSLFKILTGERIGYDTGESLN